MKKRVLLAFGTRPEAIIIAPLVKGLAKYPNIVDTRVCVTAQHRKMLDQHDPSIESIRNHRTALHFSMMDVKYNVSSSHARIEGSVKRLRQANVNLRGLRKYCYGMPERQALFKKPYDLLLERIMCRHTHLN